jgi:hypothetical protein
MWLLLCDWLEADEHSPRLFCDKKRSQMAARPYWFLAMILPK